MGGAGVVGVEGGSEQETCWETFRVQTCSPLFWPFLSWLCCRKARWRTGACWRTSSRTWRGRTNIRTTSTATKCMTQRQRPWGSSPGGSEDSDETGEADQEFDASRL